jgi:hypothetical protein
MGIRVVTVKRLSTIKSLTKGDILSTLIKITTRDPEGNLVGKREYTGISGLADRLRRWGKDL